jgi:dienelactone hydrolase
MKATFFSLATLIATVGFTQKPALTIEDIRGFSQIGSSQISNDGKYVWYKIEYETGSTLVLCAVDGSYKKEINGLPRYSGSAGLTGDSRRFIYIKPGDTLCVFDLATKREEFVTNCVSYKLPDDDNSNWLAYEKTDKSLVLYNFIDKKEHVFTGISEYIFSANTNVLVLKQKNNEKGYRLQWVTLPDLSVQTIWKGGDVRGLTFDKAGTKLAFFAIYRYENNQQNDIWYFNKADGKTERLVCQGQIGIDASMKIVSEGLQFSNHGDRLFFNLQKSDTQRKANPNLSNVELWNYKDQILQPEQSTEFHADRHFYSVINLLNKRTIQLIDSTDSEFYALSSGGDNSFLWKMSLGRDDSGSSSNRYDTSVLLVNTKDGSRRLLAKRNYFFNFSPEGKYVYWYDAKRKKYYCYDIYKGEVNPITEKIPVLVYGESLTKGLPNPFPYGSAFWLPGDKALFIYDRYDIWQVDPQGRHNPVCITNGYGRKHHIVFRLPYDRFREAGGDLVPEFKKGRVVYLNAFDEVTKQNGFFALHYGLKRNPEQLVMSSHYYYYSEPYTSIVFKLFMLKAKKEDRFLLMKESASEFPNLHVTKDFKHFVKISDLAPQKRFNWVTSQLMCWKSFGGYSSQGILYKPENFDSTKKYPVIFYFYEKLSDGLNKFPDPQMENAGMGLNIPYFVSQGYLVFCPDIYYKKNHTGESIYNYVVSAAEMLSKMQYVNPNKMGIQGQSFGGYEVNYLVTHTNLFAAAASSAGNSNLFTTAGSLIDNTKDGHVHIQSGQYRIESSMWDSLNVWIDNSPVFNVNKVNTPVLIVHGREDTRVPWLQGVEFFTSLRFLQKKAWLVSYVEGQHCFFLNERDQVDCLTRMNQFFDHYLKGKPAPIWMTQGIPAKLRLIETGYQLDPQGSCGVDCKICKEKRYDLNALSKNQK